MKFTKKASLLLFIFISNYIFLTFLQPIQANPIALPEFGSLQFGITSLDYNLTHVESIVELNVYDEITHGNGTYWLYNNENTSCEVSIIFICESVRISELENTNITANGTVVTYNFHYNFEFNSHSYDFNLSFTPSSFLCLNIQWLFKSGFKDQFTYGMGDLTTELIQFYYTGYTINGGNYWNNQSINYEKVIFNFHTEKFFVDDHAIAVKLTDYQLDTYEFASFHGRQEFISSAKKIPISTTTSGYQYMLEFTDILNNIYITIVNDNTIIIPSIMAFILMVGVVIIIGFIGKRIWKKSKEKYLRNFSKSSTQEIYPP